MDTAPTAAQIKAYILSRAAILTAASAALGSGAAGETGTLSALEQMSHTAILGDGTSANPGLGSPQWQALAAPLLQAAAAGVRWDLLFARQGGLMRLMDDRVQATLPAGWRFGTGRALDGWLTRANGAAGSPIPPPAPGSVTGTLTPITTSGGAIPVGSTGSLPGVAHTFVGSGDENESQIIHPVMPLTTGATYNALVYQIAGTVPSGVSKMRIYRTAVGGSSYGWDQDVPVTPGAVYPAVTLLKPDAALRMDWPPPQWMQAALPPACALLYALAFAATVGSVPQLSPAGMLSPGNVLAGPANGLTGLNNPPQSAILGQSHLSGTASSMFTAGSIATINSASNGIQGFAGAANVRARVTSALDGTLVPTIAVSGFDAAHGWGVTQSLGGLTPSSGFSTGAVGDVALYSLPTGFIVQSVNEAGVSGSAASGSWVYEGWQ